MEKKHESKYHFCDIEQDIGSEIKRRSKERKGEAEERVENPSQSNQE